MMQAVLLVDPTAQTEWDKLKHELTQLKTKVSTAITKKQDELASYPINRSKMTPGTIAFFEDQKKSTINFIKKIWKAWKDP